MRKRKPTAAPWIICIQSAGICLVIYLSGILLLTALILRNMVPESAAAVFLSGLAAFSTMTGGLLSAQKFPGGAVAGSLLSMALFISALILTGLCWTGINWTGEGGGILLSAAIGGVLSGILVRCSRNRKRK